MTPPTSEAIRTFVMSSHGNFEVVRSLLAEQPELLRVVHDWGPAGGLEDGIGAASHVGNRTIAEFFIDSGVVPPIWTLAMLGRVADVESALATDPKLAHARGAHGISLLFHAALSGNINVAELLKRAGATEGYNAALHGAVMARSSEMVAWLLANGVTDSAPLDYQNKTPLQRAQEYELPEIVAVLKAQP